MNHLTSMTGRPASIMTCCALLTTGALFMALLGWSASAYYVPALCLLLQAALLWSGKGHAVIKGTIALNQVSGLALVLVLWLGDGLGATKLDISGVMLLLNLLCGGPLLTIFALPMLHAMRKVQRQAQEFHRFAALEQ
ncbi:hypothetical protein D3C78_704220 [compost metagenome]